MRPDGADEGALARQMDRLADGATGRQPALGCVMVENDCGTPMRAAGIDNAERAPLVREAFRLEYVTLAWMVIEAGVAIGSGVAARSITLLAFGIDSLIELASAVLLIWRLTVELRRGQSFAESAERTARRIGGALLFASLASFSTLGGVGGEHPTA
jgi:hypothetical protein